VPTGEPTTRLRADALRNRERVLAAAEAAFGEKGASVPLDEIAARAGVGAGTVYRHFPTKQSLFEAIVLGRLERLVEAARERSSEEDPGEALFAFLGHMHAQSRESRALKDALAGAGFDAKVAASSALAELRAALAELLSRAQRAGAARTDIDVEDLMAILAAAFLAEATRRADAERADLVLTVLLDGLRPPAGRTRQGDAPGIS
jgi:AcrR family transcriptional regulator